MRRPVVLLSAVLLAACTGSPVPDGPPSTTPPAPTPSASPTPVATTSPLSGRGGGVGTPVVVVKLDNTPAAQPHKGLTAADLVYVEPVEWGLTRLAAVYSTDVPRVVGPVRSARIGDLSLLEPLGSAALVFSGAQRRLLPQLEKSDFVLVSEDLDSPGFFRERSRVSPVNLMARPVDMLAGLDDVAVSHDMGLVFDPERPAGGTPAPRVRATWEGARMEFRWNGAAQAYDVWMHGRPARDLDPPGVQRASTVVVQYVTEVDSGYGDKFGGRTPLPITVGRGEALVLRDGRSYPVTWRRSLASQPTRFLGPDGEPFPFDPGQVWIVVKDRTRPVTTASAG